MKDRLSSFPCLFGLFALLWISLALAPFDRSVWLLENVPVVLVAGVLWKYRCWGQQALSRPAMLMLFLFALLHLIGAHYSYARVPAGEWVAQELALTRNPYDRIVHFAFGFLVLPVTEDVVRDIARPLRGSTFISASILLAFAALFEIGEWLLAELAGSYSGAAYLATQGDTLDPYKDLASAVAGVILCHFLISLSQRRLRRLWRQKRTGRWTV
ncbi:DUF2238 domain-containing protein [Pacificimonas sp. ICDLI1SI03]